MEKILVVDDDTNICDFLKVFLKRMGYKVDVANTGGETLRKLDDVTKPALILLDLVLPDIDGGKILKEIKSRYKGIKVIMMTGYHSDYKDAVRVVEVINSGAETCLIKPFDLKKLQKAVSLSLNFSNR